MVKTTFSKTFNSTSSKNRHFDVCLMDETHRIKFPLKSFILSSDAKQLVKRLANKLNFPIVKYNPKSVTSK